MRLSISNKYFDITNVVLFFLLSAPFTSMFNDYYNYLVTILIFLFLLLSSFYLVGTDVTITKVNTGFLLMATLIFLIIVSHVNALDIFGFKELVLLLYPFAIYCISFLLFSKGMDLEKKISQMFFLGLLICTFISVNVSITNYNELGYATGSNWANISIVFGVFVLLSPNKYLKYVGALLLVLVVLLSLKRSSLLFILIFLFLYLFMLIRSRNLKMRNVLFGFVFLVIGFLFILYIMPEHYIERFIFRVASLQEDGGAGRVGVLEVAYAVWIDTPLLDKIFGLGYRYLNYNEYVQVVSVHNDYVDMIFSYGFIPFVLFIIVLFRYLKIAFNKVAKGDSRAPFYIGFISILITYSITSGFFYFSVMFTGVFIGMAYLDVNHHRD